MNLLRFTTAGSVDDGKSTLIGRLLYDSKAIFEDQLEAIDLASKRKGEEHINLALLTDGLKAEREQGITIDVAYRYFATPKRKFIIADTPGHIQYTRNMVTGASTADLALILVDARNGISEQTIRHSYIASLLQIKHIILCINKMDMVNFSEQIFQNIKKNYVEIAEKLNIQNVHYIPISALNGDNVVNRSEHTPWYKESSLIEMLETIEVNNNTEKLPARFPVQYIIRPESDKFHDFRGYAGQLAGGAISVGDLVVILPNLIESKITGITIYNESIKTANIGESVCITLEDDVDVSRGDMLVKKDEMPEKNQDIKMMLCWFNERPMNQNGKYIVRHTSNEVRCIIKDVSFKMDINSLTKNTQDKKIGMNDIACVDIRTSKALFTDSYIKNKITGSLILIDEVTNETMAAGMIM
ncbi:MAG TPA: sulfate adenylyltransferase [Bacteroidales bacterium]|nr:MAG: sulfate adenylyltransferase [Bacteroidetes bacterium GWF2_35_48]OFY94096.1 MAG: sulfate adenylyltransferase [Bacteroidetes bacterium RIFOXYC12_FULL_35_7]HBX52726.1 sulfate adenylyltransferase [Bacteroidales bacterium]